MFLSFPLIPLLLFSVCLCAFITFYLALRIKLPLHFGRVLRFTIFFIFLNSAYSFVKEIYFPDGLWQSRLVPFILLYGPLLHFGILALRDHKLPLKVVLLHILPFVVFLLYFVYTHVMNVRNHTTGAVNINQDLSIIGSISFVSYTMFSFSAGRKVFTRQYRDKLLMFVFARVILLFLAVLFLMMGLSKNLSTHPSGVYLLRLTIYCCMLIFMLMVFNFIVNKLLNRFSKFVIEAVEGKEIEESTNNAKYEKSTLTDAQLNEYQGKLESAMGDEQLFLDVSLSLSSLASHLKIPNHHLTQVLSVKVQQTFYQYVNGYRIKYACGLLQDHDQLNMEELAERSGFNSKPSFNRQFKASMGCTPSEYRKNSRKPHK